MSDYFLSIAEQSRSEAKCRRKSVPPLPRKPCDDEIEIIVMGAGVGESILVHVGNTNWLIIDSFMVGVDKGNARRRTPAPTQYLREIGVECNKSVKGIVLSHPHSDHVQGLNRVVDECTPQPGKCPPFYVPGILSQEYWKSLFGDKPGTHGVWAKHLQQAFSIAYENHRLVPVVRSSRLSNKLQCFHVLSPTSNAVIKRMQPDVKFFENHINLTSIVLWLDIEGVQALFGADMENHNSYGWQQILRETEMSPNHLPIFVKVPHHGSDNSMHAPLYEELIGANKYIAAITRNNNRRGPANAPLPDEETLKYHSANAIDKIVIGPRTAATPNEQNGTPRIGWVSARKKARTNAAWDVHAYGAATIC